MKYNFKREYYWLLLFAICFLAFQIIQDTIRPNYNGKNEVIIYFLGVAPNFFPSIGIPALFVVILTSFTVKNKFKFLLNSKVHITANVVSLIGLLNWEFFQPFTSRGQFDWHDVIWTLIGALIFHFLYKWNNIKPSPQVNS